MRATEGSRLGYRGAGYAALIQPPGAAGEILRSAPKCLCSSGLGAAPPSGNQSVGPVPTSPPRVAARSVVCPAPGTEALHAVVRGRVAPHQLDARGPALRLRLFHRAQQLADAGRSAFAADARARGRAVGA